MPEDLSDTDDSDSLAKNRTLTKLKDPDLKKLTHNQANNGTLTELQDPDLEEHHNQAAQTEPNNRHHPLHSSASAKSDPGPEKRPCFNIGVHDDDDSEDDDEDHDLVSHFPTEPSGRLQSQISCPNGGLKAKRKNTVIHVAPLTVVPLGEEEGPGSRNVRFHSDSAVLHSNAKDPKLVHVFRRPIVERWKKVVERALSLDDPWKKYRIEKLPVQSMLRHRYSAIRAKWVVDRVEVKMQKEQFANGAMRKCFRLKKLSNHGHYRNNDWAHAHNYVAKSYIEPVPKDIYFEDVKLQMDAKLWAEEYNRHRPPKKVDIFQISILELEKEDGESEFFHLEHFIEGNYIKYNSNSGFVDDVGRQTPQAFSHFTFERSGHQQIVVDVQGVDDLYTDPQVHTVGGSDYGDGNLGTKGMALFFHSHECNQICTSMGLTSFDLAPSEKADKRKRLTSLHVSIHENSKTVCRGLSKMVESADVSESSDIIDFLRQRTMSERSPNGSTDNPEYSPTPQPDSPAFVPSSDGIGSNWSVIESEEANEANTDLRAVNGLPGRRQRYDSELDASVISGENGSTTSSFRGEKAEREAYWSEMRKMSRPAGVGDNPQLNAFLEKVRAEDRARETMRRSRTEVLGRVHLDIARYHELGRFLPTEDQNDLEGKAFDKAAAWFHLDMAAKFQVNEALLTCARIYLDMPHDILPDFRLETTDDEEKLENEDQGLDYMTEAAEGGDLGANLFLAEAYRNGAPLGTERAKSYREAVYWYEKALEIMGEEEDTVVEATPSRSAMSLEPKYQIQANLAEMYLEGGQGLDKDPMKSGDLFNEAAEGCMEAGKGKLSTKYFARAEEAWAEVEEPTEE